MVSLESAEKALKSVYLGVVANQLNTGVNPFMAKIEQTTSDVWGKQIIKAVPYGLNGGVGAGTETGELPAPAANNYERFTLDLKNLYGRIEISDKAMKASQSTEGAFVNLLNAEMEGLLKASKFNLGRMLFGDGSGKLSKCESFAVTSNFAKVSDIRNFMVGMVVDIYTAEDTVKEGCKNLRVIGVDEKERLVYFDRKLPEETFENTYYITVQGSRNNEITGLEAIFAQTGSLYGLDKETHRWLIPKTDVGGVMSMDMIQSRLDYVEYTVGGSTDMILCSYDVRRKYVNLCSAIRFNVDYMELDGGYKSVAYNGIPLVADRFVGNGCMYLLNSADFKLHQLGDWRWIEGDSGKVLHQNGNTATYNATLVKYAELICDRPIGQVKLTGIMEG